MQGQLSQKERMLLEDLKTQEDLCVIKYRSYAEQAKDPALKQLFTQISGMEHQHYDTINQLLGGQTGAGRQSGDQTAQMGQSGNQATGQINLTQAQGSGGGNTDKYLLQDMLATEKYVSGAYDTGVFESSKPNIRQALQHIQKEEQNHGEQLFQYMSSHGMYQVQ